MPTAATRPALLLALLVAVLVTTSAPAWADTENSQVGGEELYDPGVHVGQPETPLPATQVNSFVIADLDSGEILAAQNAHQKFQPASTLKMLTALTVLPRLKADDVYTAVPGDVEIAGSRVGMVAGSTYSAQQLLEAMFLVSGNDAAMALANLNGGVNLTVKQMQTEAGRLQAYDTKVINTSGLDAPGQVSSAYDIALMARAGMARDDFPRLASLVNSTFPVEGTGDPAARPTFEMWNQNTIVTGSYPGGIGVKSGYTSQAGRTLAAAAARDGKRVLVALMGIQSPTYEAGQLYLDWAFANIGRVEPVGTLVSPKFVDVPSDSAEIVAVDQRIALGISVSPVTMPPPPSGRGIYVLTAFTIACFLIVRHAVRAPFRRAMRRKMPVRTFPDRPNGDHAIADAREGVEARVGV